MKKIPKQEYAVEFETGTLVTLTAHVYHENQTQLTDEEIIDEAKGYLKDAGIYEYETDTPTITRAEE